MPDYPNPDDFFNNSKIEYGVGEGEESIRQNLRSTNGAAHRTEAAVAAVAAKIDKLDAFLTTPFKYENQAEGGEGTNNLISSQNATNGQVYRTAAEVTAMRAELAEVKALLQKLVK